MDYLKTNNFDLIRLVAASQVMVFHALFHLDVDADGLRAVVGYFPGVPAFFFVSGFLISASWERNSDWRVYAVNRALRIFPALVGVLLFSLLTLFLFYDIGILKANAGKLLLWSLSQVTILQDWNPAFLAAYGVGGMNGSLWTIPVELSFYAFVPVLYLLFSGTGAPRATLATVTLLSFTLLYLVYGYRESLPELVFKLTIKSPLPWVGMFCVGVFAQLSMTKVVALARGRFVPAALLYVGVAGLAAAVPLFPLLKGDANYLGVFNMAALCLLVLAAAFTRPELAERLLHRNDISYGVYIFHMPVINMLLVNGLTGWTGFWLSLGITTGLATLSWRYIEKPALGLRSWALYRR